MVCQRPGDEAIRKTHRGRNTPFITLPTILTSKYGVKMYSPIGKKTAPQHLSSQSGLGKCETAVPIHAVHGYSKWEQSYR
jgi:hypothetical protein